MDSPLDDKSCTLVGSSIAMFPDAITKRGTKHLLGLANLENGGTKSAAIFLVHWPKARWFIPKYRTGLEFSRTLLSVKTSVMIRTVSVEWKEGPLRRITRELSIPWRLIAQEAHDSGNNLIVFLVAW